MTYLEAEKQLVLFLAGLLGLEPDRNVFAGALPVGMEEGITVSLEEGHPATQSLANTFTALICGYSRSRRNIRTQAFEAASALPVFGQQGLLSISMNEKMPLKFAVSGEKEDVQHSFSLCLTVSFV